jgi:transketolase
MHVEEPLRTLCVNTIKMLAVDAVEKANSGHPGMPMGCADLAFELFVRHLRYDPKDPKWPGRDRFVLSAGHGSMLLYSLLHLTGTDLSLDELKRFRQLDSKTPGHPESHITLGVETTTGPLGQGIVNAVGMAIAGRMLAARFPEQPDLFGYRVFGIASDGDLMEGISHEGASLAGHLGLDNLIFFYDDNEISIDGDTALALSDDAQKRFEAYGWSVQRIDGHDPAAIAKALDVAVGTRGKPSLIIARTQIGRGSPNKQGSEKAHGSPLGKDEVALTKKALGWPESETFHVPSEVRAVFEKRAAELAPLSAAWRATVAGLSPEIRARIAQFLEPEVPEGLVDALFAKAAELAQKPDATRSLAGKIEQVAARLCPWLVGGSADLAPSCNTTIEGAPAIARGAFGGRNFHYGVREHAMGSINNGIAVTSGFVPFGSTFLIFSDYMRPAIRLAALSRLQNVFVFTHDSIFLGEDGPTHQPIEQLASLRLIPGLRVWRPADAFECAAAWAYAIERKHAPTAIVLTRQKLAPIDRPFDPRAEPRAILAGAHRVLDPADANIVLVATGSEVALAVSAAKAIERDGLRARVVSAPCLEALEDAGEAALHAVLPEDGLPRVSLEAGRTTAWKGVVGRDGLTIGIDDFGHSAPDKDLAVRYGLTTEAVADRIRVRFARR